MNLKNWISLARESWRENNPSLFKELNRSGKLGEALKRAAEQTHEEMSALEAAGYSNQEAWEMTREKYLLLPPEKTSDEPSRAGALFNEATNLQTQILQEISQDELQAASEA